jgi:acyl-CoA synthetase (AMP-forming)/AMP-acid ligase II
MAAAFLALASTAVTAPLNPAYTADEFGFYMTDLGVKAVIVERGGDHPARAAAGACGIPIIELATTGSDAGDFILTPLSESLAVQPAAVQPASVEPRPDDLALLLHTSGTTARPKIVPLRHRNLAVSAQNISDTLQLGPDDICLNIMPLFHIHGLVAAVLASISAGASVICAPGLSGFRFFSWFRDIRPTWYTAVPTMHQTLLELAPRFKDTIAAGRLRFIRSSSASLPAPTMEALEAAFGVPVIEAYGMTEAAHQMASNPLPPAPRYPGSVGLPAGPEVAIMGSDGTMLPAGASGEVVIRGPNVISGYESNPDANATSFTHGWFRTGDEGILDAAGYLRLTGRLKEFINRAGEKISPLAVDDVLLRHPAVRQAITFAMPSKLFGEEVAAAVVLHDGATPTADALREFVAERLAPFKVPRQIVFVSEIPKGPTGKPRRIGLAALLGLTG